MTSVRLITKGKENSGRKMKKLLITLCANFLHSQSSDKEYLEKPNYQTLVYLSRDQNGIKDTLNKIIYFFETTKVMERPNKYEKWELSPPTIKEKIPQINNDINKSK